MQCPTVTSYPHPAIMTSRNKQVKYQQTRDVYNSPSYFLCKLRLILTADTLDPMAIGMKGQSTHNGRTSP